VSAAPPPAPSPRLRRLKVVALVVLLVGLVLDLASKEWMEALLEMDPGRAEAGRRIEVIEGFFALEAAFNPGVTFGLAPGKTVPILVFTLIATLALGVWLFATRQDSAALHVGLGMVLAGALGNLWDRLQWTKVRDFFLIYLGEPASPSFEWPNFNVADSLIVSGVVLILWDELVGRTLRARRDRRAAAKAASEAA
jgi:signal peptidase II